MVSALMIVNPVAGKLRARSTLMDIIEVYSAANWDVNVRISQRRGHSRELARNAKRADYDRIICIGGDGTLNEVISGVLDSGEDIPLGYIPLGSTNDFATSINLPKNPAAAAKRTIYGLPLRLDVGNFNNERKFSYIASFGVFTSASYSAPQSIKNTLGHFAYILEGIKSLQDIINLKSYALHIEADDEVYDGEFMFGAIANSTSIGGILKLNSEMVDMSDGLFEMMLIRKINNLSELNQVVLSLAKSDYNNKMFTFIHASSFKITTNSEMSWSLDGEEALSGPEINITNIHHAIALYK